MTLRLRFWGTRGSIPSPGPTTVRYGGNTPCVEVRTDTDWLVILDAGTGIRELGRSLVASANGNGIAADIFLTHAHWDHIQGIPFFAPIFQPGNHFTIWGSKTLETSIDRVIRDQMSPVVFPVTFEQLDAHDRLLRDRRGAARRATGIDVTAFAVRHPGGALGYRFSAAERKGRLVRLHLGQRARIRARAVRRPDRSGRNGSCEFVRGATVLVHDATYTADEYETASRLGTFDVRGRGGAGAGRGGRAAGAVSPRPGADGRRSRSVRGGMPRASSRRRGGTLKVTAAAEGMTLSV